MSDDVDGGSAKLPSWRLVSILSAAYHGGRCCYHEVTANQLREHVRQTKNARKRLEQVADARRAAASRRED